MLKVLDIIAILLIAWLGGQLITRIVLDSGVLG